MELLLREGKREFWLHRYEAGAASPVVDVPYPLLLWNSGGAPREDVAFAVLYSGARYVVCGGECCEGWHDQIDMAWAVESASDLDPAAVMTSWHTGETEADVVSFFVNNTNFDQYDFKKLLVVMTGPDTGAPGRLEAALRRTLLGERC